MKRIPWQAVLVTGLALAAATWQPACGADSSDSAGWDAWTPRDSSDGSGWEGADADADADADAPAEVDTWLPPEVEEPTDFHAPRGSNRFVFLSNPVGDNVVVIDSQRLTLELVEVGDTPTELATLGAEDAAVVIDSGSDDVAVIRAAPGLPADVAFEAIAPGANAVSVSPDGRHGITFYDVDSRIGTRPPNMQEVTLLVFDPAEARRSQRTTVRSLPVAVDWTSDGTTAFVIGWDGMTVVDFALVGEGYRPTNISFGTTVDPADPFGTEIARRMDNVDVSGDGRLAVLSKADAAELLLLDIETQVITPIALPSAPTDVDLADDGLFALAALRDERQVARVDLADPSAPLVYLTTVSGVVPGQVVIAPEADLAVVFSNAAEFEAIGVLDMLSGDTTVVPLQKSVRAVAITPTGEAAVVIHNKKDGDPDDPRLDPVTDLDEIIDRTYGFSLVRFNDGLVVRQETPCDPGTWLVYPDAHKAFLTLRDDAAGVRDVLVADLIDFVTDTVHLGSPPASLGLAPLTRKVFVGQEHATGRITFISADTGAVQTVTGFELNDWIVE
jgi:hypothetical protein